jgi:hypothetical protein
VTRISLTLDGNQANMVTLDIWHKHNVEAGADMVLRLKPMPLPRRCKYALNHYPKGLVERNCSDNRLAQVAVHNGRVHNTHVWQVVPDISEVQPGSGRTHRPRCIHRTWVFFTQPHFLLVAGGLLAHCAGPNSLQELWRKTRLLRGI